MVSTRLRRRTTRYAPLLCSVLAMSGAEASPRAKLNSSLHRSAHVLGLLVHLALLSKLHDAAIHQGQFSLLQSVAVPACVTLAYLTFVYASGSGGSTPPEMQPNRIRSLSR